MARGAGDSLFKGSIYKTRLQVLPALIRKTVDGQDSYSLCGNKYFQEVTSLPANAQLLGHCAVTVKNGAFKGRASWTTILSCGPLSLY